MKKIFFVVIINASFLFGMNNDRSMQILLNNNGKLLKNLIANEESGHYISELLATEKILQQFWKKITPTQRSTYSNETQELVECIIDRPQARKELFKAVIACQHEKINAITRKNPYIAYAYGYGYQSNKINRDNEINFLEHRAPILEYAVIKNCTKCARELVAAGANVNALNKYNQTPLFSANSIHMFKFLCSYNADLSVDDYQKRHLLHYYVENNNVLSIIENLLSHDCIDINAQDCKGDTALHRAMKRAHGFGIEKYKVLELLLANGASLDIPNNQGQTPVEFAILSGDTITQEFLKKYGYVLYPFYRVIATVNPYDLLINNASYFKSLSPNSRINKALAEFFLFLYCNEKNSDKNDAAIMCSDLAFVAKKATFENLKNYFGENGVNFIKPLIDEFIVRYSIDTNNTNWLEELLNTSFSLDLAMPNALYYAINNDRSYLIPLLIEHGSDFTRCDENGKTPLQNIESKGNRKEITLFKSCLTQRLSYMMLHPDKHKEVRLLLQHGADSNQRDLQGNSWFHHDMYHHGCYAQELIKAGVDINKGCISPLWLAAMKKNMDYLILLLQNGARTAKEAEVIWLKALLDTDITMIKAFLTAGTVINKEKLENDKNTEEIKNILKEAYKNQECCVCLEHNDDVSYVPCKNLHANYFLCKGCYDNIKLQGNKCPVCRHKMNAFVTA